MARATNKACLASTPRQRSKAGFTLIELLVVMVIVGVIITAATLVLSDPKEAALEAESNRFVALLELAKEDAVFQGRELAVGFWQQGYAFYELDEEGKWQAITRDRQLRERQLPDEMEVELYLEGLKVTLNPNPETEPQVYVLSSGELIPFEAVLSIGYDHSRRLVGDAIGNVTVETADAS